MRAAAHQVRPILSGAGPSPWPARFVAAVNLVTQVAFALAAGANAQVVKIADSPSKIAITDDARAKARDVFTERCAACHGPDGRGNGPAAANLKPKPIDFHRQNWQKSVTDDSITKAII